MRRIIQSTILLAALLSSFGCCTAGRAGGRVTTSATTTAIDAVMTKYAGHGPGASVLVVRDDTIVFRGSYGLADVEAGVAITPSTNFRLASVTKQFTATAIEILAERSKLAYDDPITRFLPTLPPYASQITIRQLLTHSSGLLDYEDLMDPTDTRQVHDADVLHLLERTDHTYFPPGSSYRYSNTGYSFLALIIEHVSGESFATFLTREIFTPLGMHGTVAYEAGISTVQNRAFGYEKHDGAFVRHDQSTTSAVLGDGGIYSSIDDLFHWDQALEHATLVRPETLTLAFTPAVATDDPAIRYGFGWRISSHHGQRTLWHSGETAGFRNVIVRFPDNKLTIVILTNRGNAEPHDAALEIADLFRH